MACAAFAAEIWYIGDMNTPTSHTAITQTVAPIAASRAISILLLGPMFLSTILAFLGVIAIMVFVAPKFQAIVADFGLKLSGLQVAFFRTADLVRGGGSGGSIGLWVVLVPLVFLVALPIGLMSIAPGTRTIGRFLVLLMFLIAILLVLVTVYSCYSPLISLIENLATDQKGAI